MDTWSDNIVEDLRRAASTGDRRSAHGVVRSILRKIGDTPAALAAFRDVKKSLDTRRNGHARVVLGSYLCQIGMPGGVAMMVRGSEEAAGRTA